MIYVILPASPNIPGEVARVSLLQSCIDSIVRSGAKEVRISFDREMGLNGLIYHSISVEDPNQVVILCSADCDTDPPAITTVEG